MLRTTSPTSARPGAALGAYPERDAHRRASPILGARHLAAYLPAWARLRAIDTGRFLALVGKLGEALTGASPAALDAFRDDLRLALRRDGARPDLVARSFALTREHAARLLAQRPYDVQVVAGWVMHNQMVAEMDTGEGKTLAASLPAIAAALAGTPVHVVTANDYLAARDAESLAPLYRAMGLTVGTVTADTDPAGRQAAYARDVTYCVGKELVFDYLRDRVVTGRDRGAVKQRVERLYGAYGRSDHIALRGLCFAIVDECDSVMIDEARVPLVLSGPGGETLDPAPLRRALDVAGALREGADFEIQGRDRDVRLTDAGCARVAAAADSLGPGVSLVRQREGLIANALRALHLFQRDRHYVRRDRAVLIVDEHTGRVRPGHSWERGLHQMVEVKEGLAPSAAHRVMARISFQRFFRRYLRLAGMSGTVREVAGELRSVYGLGTVAVPTHRPSRRRDEGERVFADAEAKWHAVVERVVAQRAAGRPVLVGTRSVAESDALSARLAAAGVEHLLLSARQDRDEAAVVARAGEAARVTVATDIAGRGTDIALAAAAASAGGLHVIAAERHESRRIDRQLFGRCGRQGDPGSFEMLFSLDEHLLRDFGAGAWLRHGVATLGGSAGPESGPGQALGRWLGRLAQARAERHYAVLRAELLAADDKLDDALAFAGRPE